MPRRCSICDHQQRPQIDKALAAGKQGYRSIAARFRISPSALTRHKPHTAATVAKAHARREVNLGESLLQKLDRLERRLETTYTDSVELLATAKAAGDTATAVRAINAIRNVLAESRQQIEVLGELRGELDRRPQINISTLAPVIISAFDVVPDEHRAAVKAAVAAELMRLDKTLDLPPA
jgi:uncharacterized protein (UPF0335 family)